MDDGKSAKAKWWSRPRHRVPAPDTEAGPTPPAATPTAPAVTGAAPSTVTGATPPAEAEAARPAGPQPSPSGPQPSPSGPQPSPSGPQPTAPSHGQGQSGTRDSGYSGDYELDRPLPTGPTGPAGQAGSTGQAGQAGPAGNGPASAASGGAASGGALTAGADSAGAETVGAEKAGGGTGERGAPLHDPDPHSTPPYGEPGPWAPAPPVQHPGTRPAHGIPAHGDPAHDLPTPDLRSPGATPHGGPPPGAVPGGGAVPAYPGTYNPWQNYDPWAVAPLQQNGAAVETTVGRRRRGKRATAGGAVLIALLSGGVGGAIGSYLERTGGVSDIQLPQAGVEDTGRAPDSVAGIAARALPGVVTLHVRGAEGQGTGTGFVLDDRGHILTNNHVVDPAGSDGRISVTFSGGETANAEVVGRDSGYDLAVVRVRGVSGLKPLALGNSDNVRVGDPVVAIGAPFDLANTVTSGIISAKERPITAGGEKGDGSDISYVDALQTDAPINPGNSGGPLVDSKARVIGINSAIRSADGGSDPESGQAGSIGLGFAIPINQGKRVAEELINTGKATHPVIGVTLDMDYDGDGARVGTKGRDGGAPVNPGGPGDKAGIRAGDIITEVDGQRVHSGEELIVKIRAHRPGDRLELTLERGGRERTITLTLGSADGG
ncbi:trypsin-like peptidase domain-containing protein [Streptomyces cavernae]|uniref:trypsin-like peptidase domain-containing protein n=1 Tax=Streptomyces cavernae TaxID=2259034 RepID=UPI000FEBFAFC|nr:trypsin-like peptidase domain-containing protein [Streptomyces cavernae]